MKNLFKLFGNLNRDRRSKVPLLIIALATVIGFSMTACPEDNDGRDLPPEEKPVQDRWTKWVAGDSTATLEYEVNADGVCQIIVGGIPEPNNSTDGYYRWKTDAQYAYTAKANTIYTYEFEAWTESDTRGLTIQYYYEDGEYKHFYPSINSTPTTYRLTGEPIPKDGVRQLQFQCADKTGKFFVKVLNIKEAGTEKEADTKKEADTEKSIAITGIPGGYDMARIDIFDENETPSAGGYSEISGGSITIPLMIEDGYYNPINTPFTGSGEFYVQLMIVNSSTSTVKIYLYANGTTFPEGFILNESFDLDKLPKVSITDAVTTIAFNKFAHLYDIVSGGEDSDYDD